MQSVRAQVLFLVAAFSGAVSAQEIRITSGPADNQVFQRTSEQTADISFNGVASGKKVNGKEVEARLIAAACRNIGLPEPLAVEIHKHSAIKGAPSAYPARGQLSRPDWSFPKDAKFAGRPRRHIILRFAANIEGPVILGAGRFYGFGLCLPLVGERSP